MSGDPEFGCQPESAPLRATDPDERRQSAPMLEHVALAIAVIVILFLIGQAIMAIASFGDSSDEPQPEDTVEEYWQAIDSGDMEAATSLAGETLSLNWTAQIDPKNASIDIRAIETRAENPDSATVYAEVRIEGPNDGLLVLDVYHDLEFRDGEWNLIAIEEHTKENTTT